MPTARRAWTHFEPVHDIIYFAPDQRTRTDAAGLRGFWMAYFAMRSAPLGAATPEVVSALFYGFHPSLVHRALPAAWTRIDPAAALALRGEVVDAGLRAVLGDAVVESAQIAEAADLAWDAAQACDVGGRALAAANQALPRSGTAVLDLWQATSVLREHRGDGHIAVLVARGITPLQAHLLKVGANEADDTALRTARGYQAEGWERARADLRDAGLLDAADVLTERGRAEREAIEQNTDAIAEAPWREIGEERTEQLLALLCPLARTMLGSGTIPTPSPVGLAFEPDCRHD